MIWAGLGRYPNLAEKMERDGSPQDANVAEVADVCESSDLFLQIDVLDIFNGVGEKALSQPAEFLHRIGGKEFEAGQRAALLLRLTGGGSKVFN